MPAAVNTQNLTLNAQEATDFNKVIFDYITTDEAFLTKVHDIVTGVKMKEQIVFGSELGDGLKVLKGCKPDTAQGFELSEKFWDPEIFAMRLEHCQNDVDRLFKMWQNFERLNPDFFELDSDELAVLLMAIKNALPTNILTIAWFADKETETITDGGVFKDGTDLDLYNGINGIWKQIFAEINAGKSNYVNIAKNAGANYNAQTLTPAEARGVLNSLYFAASSEVRSNDSSQFLVTRGIYDGYLQSLASGQETGGGNTFIVENGQKVLRFFGHEVVPMDVWDKKIKQLFDNGTKSHLPNRAVFTTKFNIPLGTTSEEDFNEVRSIFDPRDNVNLLDVYLNLDAKLLKANAAAAAY